MEFSQIFDIFYQNLLATTWLEIIAVVCGLLSVWYARRVNILVYPTGIVSVLIYVYICSGASLYADMGINFFYFIMSVYGWYNWTRKDDSRKVVPISWNTAKDNIISIAGMAVFFVILVYVLKTYTDSNVPIWDSFTTAIFIVAMWLMARKKVENWILWIIGNIASIPLYYYKGLVLTSFQYSVFLLLAVAGFIEWRRRIKAGDIW